MSKFKHSAFIRKNTPELREKLVKMGYTLIDPDIHNKLYVFENVLGNNIVSSYTLGDEDEFIDCGADEELFLAIAAITDEHDKDQWFISHCVLRFEKLKGRIKTESGKRQIKGGEFFKCLSHHVHDFPVRWMSFSNIESLARKATPDELIEHFKNKQ